MVRTLILIAILAVAMTLLGWLTFSNSSSSTTIIIDKAKVQQDAGEALQKAKEFARDVEEKVDDAVRDGTPKTRWPSVP